MNFKLEPLKRDKSGRDIFNGTRADFYSKIAAALFQAQINAAWLDFKSDDNGFSESDRQYDIDDEIFSLIQVMTLCATKINRHGLTEQQLAEIQEQVIEVNRSLGYFEEK